MPNDLDNFDRSILYELQKDARLSQNELGNRINLSTAAVNRRIKRLVDDKVIEKFTTSISPSALGYPLTIVTIVEIESENQNFFDEVLKTFMDCPFVQQCYYVAGEWDFVLIFNVESMEKYTDLSNHLFFANDNVKRFKSMVSMQRVKVGLDIPVQRFHSERTNE